MVPRLCRPFNKGTFLFGGNVIKDRDIESNFDSFNDYASKYNLEDDMIRFKFKHSFRVIKLCEDIAKNMGYSKDEVYIASLIGLLHDIGRFEQWTKYKTFNDSKEFDHSSYAVKLLFEDNFINNFNCKKTEWDYIKYAILYHNDFSLPIIKNKKIEKFCKIIRDADKLDILYSFEGLRALEIEECEEEITEKVKESFFNYETVNVCDRKNNNDKIVGLLSLVFDINYDYSFMIIKDEKYIDKLFERINNKKVFNIYFETINSFIESKVD